MSCPEWAALSLFAATCYSFGVALGHRWGYDEGKAAAETLDIVAAEHQLDAERTLREVICLLSENCTQAFALMDDDLFRRCCATGGMDKLLQPYGGPSA